MLEWPLLGCHCLFATLWKQLVHAAQRASHPSRARCTGINDPNLMPQGSVKSDSQQQEQHTPQFPAHSSSSSPRTTNGDKDSSPGWTPESGTPQRLLTPCSSQKARAAAVLTSLHTLHEEAGSQMSSGEGAMIKMEGARVDAGHTVGADVGAGLLHTHGSVGSHLGRQAGLLDTPGAAGSNSFGRSSSKAAEATAALACVDAAEAAAAPGSPREDGEPPRPKFSWRRSLTPKREKPEKAKAEVRSSSAPEETAAPLQLPTGLQQQQHGVSVSQPLPLLSVIQAHQQQLPKSASSPALWQLQLQESVKEEQQHQPCSRLDKQQQQLQRHPLFSPRHTAEGHAAFSSSHNRSLGSLSRIVVRAGAGDLEDSVVQQLEQPSSERRLTWQQSIQRVALRFGAGSWGRSAGNSRASLGGAGDGMEGPVGPPGRSSKDNMAFRTSKSSLMPWESLR